MGIYYMPTADEIKEARLSAKLTQQQSAHLCMVTPNSWARYEQGAMKMSAPIWELFIMKVAQLSVTQEQPKKLTVYEQKQLDKQAEAEKLAQQEERYRQQMEAREQAELARREALLPRFNELMDTLKLRFGRQLKEFEQCESSHELTIAIMNMEKLYAQYKDEVDAMNDGTYVEPTRNWGDSFSLDDEFK